MLYGNDSRNVQGSDLIAYARRMEIIIIISFNIIYIIVYEFEL